jgi:hypothetical protein
MGGHSRTHDDAGRDVAALSLDSLQWERPEGARRYAGMHGHTATSISRRLVVGSDGWQQPRGRGPVLQLTTYLLRWRWPLSGKRQNPRQRMLQKDRRIAAVPLRHQFASPPPQVLFGLRGEEASSSASVLAADTLRWAPAAARPPAGAAGAAAQEPTARLSHAAACVRERVYVFGGMTGDGLLLGDLWSLDTDSMQWAQHATFGAAPAPRKGAQWGACRGAR